MIWCHVIIIWCHFLYSIIDISNVAIIPDTTTSGQTVTDKTDKDTAALETAHQELISSYEWVW